MIITEATGGAAERAIVTAMVVDRHALSVIAPKWDPMEGLFDSKYGNIVGTWCVNHYKKYKTAPAAVIETYFDRWSEKQKDKALIGLVQKFITGLSGAYARLKKKSQTNFVIDAAGVYFTKVKQRKLRDEMTAHLENGDVDKIEKLLAEYGRVELGLGSGVDVMEDAGAMQRAFEQKSEPLIVYKGAMGTFFGNSLERDGFVSFEAPEKRGKTWILMDIAWTAMLQGRKVAFFEVGDLSEAQALRRFGTRAARRPMEPEPYTYPLSIEPAGDSPRTTALVEERKADKALTWEQAVRACKKITHKRSGEPLLKLSTHAMSSISIMGVSSVLETWARTAWVPDVIVIDYADILAPQDGRADSRDQVNATWKGMRMISQQLHGLTVTATQTDADSYDTDIISMSNFSEDKRKRAHVTGSIGINQTEAEKEVGITRFNWIVRREWAYSKNKCVHCAGALALARPIIHSTF